MEAKSREQELEAAGFIVSMMKKKRKTSWHFIFMQPMTPSQRVVLSTFKVEVFTSTNLTNAIPQRHAQMFVNW